MKLKLKQTMTSHPVTVKHDEDLKTAYLKMKSSGIRHLPVLDDHDHVVGIISDKDFQRVMVLKSIAGSNAQTQNIEFQQNIPVSDLMSWPVKTLSHVNDLATAVRMMIQEKISSIVITEKEEMVGILTHEDLLRVLESYLTKPESLKDKVKNFAYNSPIGDVLETLNTIGI